MLALRGTKAFPKHYGKEKSIIKSSTCAFNEKTVVQQKPLKFMLIPSLVLIWGESLIY